MFKISNVSSHKLPVFFGFHIEVDPKKQPIHWFENEASAPNQSETGSETGSGIYFAFVCMKLIQLIRHFCLKNFLKK